MTLRSIALVAILVVSNGLLAQAPTTATPPATPSPSAVDTAPVASIEEAYRKEFAFLEAQRQELARRLEQTRERQAGVVSDLQRQVDRLQDEVVAGDARVDRQRGLLNEGEEQAIANTDNQEILSATFQQAGVTLEQFGRSIDNDDFEALADDVKVQRLFELGGGLLTELSSIRRETGTFYGVDGSEINGELLKVGNIATYGQSPEAAGVLAPAGGGRLKLWPVDTADAARALISGQADTGDLTPIFLYESLNREVETKKEKTALDVINSGGTIGWVIVILGLIGALLIAMRIIFLKRAGASVVRLTDEVAPMVRDGRRDDALARLKRSGSAPARVMAAAIRNIDRDRDHVEDIVSEAILHESAHLNRFGTFIIVTAAVAPLLGLLGTVTGMIQTFDIITEFGTGDPALLSGGIATALVTTELGLIVAIPTLLVGNMLSSWAESIKDDMEKAALHVINVEQDRRRSVKLAA